MIKVVLLGAGRIARRHGALLRKLARKDVACYVASRDRARAEDVRRAIGGAGVFASYDEALAADVDVVMVLTPPHLHLPQALAALAAGKHVVLEKPPLPRAADFAAVEAAAAAAGRRVFVAENYFYKPVLRRLRALLADGVVGDPLFLHVNAIKHQRIAAGDWRGEPGAALGGALYEGGIHWIDFLANLGLEVTRVRGFRPRLAAGASLERSMMVGFDYREGAVGMLSYSWEVPTTFWGLRLSKIYGRRGTITFETNGLWVLAHGTRTRPYLPGVRDLAGYRAMLTDFVGAWKDGREPELTFARARRDLELVEQAYATATVPGDVS
ncbi:MAG TPA: Gfo/Idh/MocA family oxidoreductase [Kofleriaceae bacterium]|nr:Gfo/Idh/MocA family oxidoreductase [Kofleriaceae bacterium]